MYFVRCFSGALDCFSSDICFLIVGYHKSLRFFSFGSLSLLHLSGVWRMVKEKVNKINLFWIQCFWFVHFSSFERYKRRKKEPKRRKYRFSFILQFKNKHLKTSSADSQKSQFQLYMFSMYITCWAVVHQCRFSLVMFIFEF